MREPNGVLRSVLMYVHFIASLWSVVRTFLKIVTPHLRTRNATLDLRLNEFGVGCQEERDFWGCLDNNGMTHAQRCDVLLCKGLQ